MIDLVVFVFVVVVILVIGYFAAFVWLKSSTFLAKSLNLSPCLNGLS